MNPIITEVTCTISLFGTDGAGHNITKSITFDMPALQPGIDFVPPTAVINVTPGTAGTEPFTVIFDAYGSTDNRGIASYAWDFGDGTTATGVIPDPHTYTESGSYIVKLTVTDYFGNEGIAFVTITVGEAGAPTAVIKVTPSTTGNAPFKVYFDASGSSVVSDCGACSIESYSWNFGDGTTGTGVMPAAHIYTSVGTYTVILTVTDSNGNTAYDSVTITVTESGLPSSITIQAVPTLVTSATGSSAITVTVKDSSGNPVPNGTDVTLLTTFGTLSSYAETTVNGIVTTVLTFSAEGPATVTAISGSINNSVEVTCAVP
jgi:PKD repeat protein